jgi:hypothetical protein
LVDGVQAVRDQGPVRVPVTVRDGDGDLVPDSMPVVTMVKHGQYIEEGDSIDVDQEVGILARLDRALERHPLAGFIAEGGATFGSFNESAEVAFRRVAFSGYPVVKVGRGNADGVAYRHGPVSIAGGNLSATKARLLLMACLLRFGGLPPARDPDAPTATEVRATEQALDRFREIFASH